MRKIVLPLIISLLSFANFANTLEPDEWSEVVQEWENNMVVYGELLCDEQNITDLGVFQGNVWYYDGIKVYFQIADYTGDDSWKECESYVENVYKPYVLNSTTMDGPCGAIPGYCVFPHGLYQDFMRNNDETSKEAVICMSKYAAVAHDLTPLESTVQECYSREVAYNINSMITAQKLGEPHRTRLDDLFEQALGHIDQWFLSFEYCDPNVGFAPFMFALTSEALINYYYEINKDPRIIQAIQMGLDWIWQNAWYPEEKAFYLRMAGVEHYPAPDLNLLIAPVFAWIYMKTGDINYRDMGDIVFQAGVNGAFLVNGKHFSQNYRWSFDYLRWREAGNNGVEVEPYYPSENLPDAPASDNDKIGVSGGCGNINTSAQMNFLMVLLLLFSFLALAYKRA